MVENVHERRLDATPEEVGALLDGLASPGDRLWPADRWPPMRLDRPLGPGARGGHGPVRYAVETYQPGRRVAFRFADDLGLDGSHAFEVAAAPGGGAVLRHVLTGRTRGAVRLTWPLAVRWLHDAVVEDALDRAEAAVSGTVRAPARWSPWVRVLRAGLVAADREPAPVGRRGRRAGLAAGAALGALAGLHVLWASGSTWPLPDREAFARLVVDVDPEALPGPGPTLAVAGLLGAATGLVLLRAADPAPAGRPALRRLAQAGSAGVAAVLAARGLGGLAVSVPRLAAGSPAPFPRWDVALYDPLCLGLAALVAAAAAGERSPRPAPS